MKIVRYQITGWSVFFGLVSITILVAFAMPAAFGLQTFNQWGGMYVDRWCHVESFSANPHVVTGSSLISQYENVGESGTRSVYTTPMHNEATCVMWARNRCGQVTADGWTIVWVKTSMNRDFFIGDRNVCDLSLPSSNWFPNA